MHSKFLTFAWHRSLQFSILLLQVNVVIRELFASEVLGQIVPEKLQSQVDPDKSIVSVYYWSTGLKDEDDNTNKFKNELKKFLLLGSFYSVEEFL